LIENEFLQQLLAGIRLSEAQVCCKWNNWSYIPTFTASTENL